MLLTIEEIKIKLDEKFLPLENVLNGFRMVESLVDQNELKKLEAILCLNLPESYKKLILLYDFGNLTIGPIVFGNNENYFDIIKKYNLTKTAYWWAGGFRPSNIVMIANSDPYAVCLNCSNGEILAFLHEQNISNCVSVALNFEIFVRGIGTAFFKRLNVLDKHNLALQIIKETSSKDSSFWIQLIT